MANLFRFQRLHRYGPRSGEIDGLQFNFEFQQSLPGNRAGRILDALAYQSFKLVSRLRLYSAGRKPKWKMEDLPESFFHFPAFRDLAWSGMDLCHLGGLARFGRAGH